MILRQSFFICSVLAGLLSFPVASYAGDDTAHMRDCIQRATEKPDLALAEADAWSKKGGGDGAIVCRATAQFHRNEFAKAAEDFMQVAARQKDSRQASLLYQQAGLSYTRGANFAKAEDAYGKAIQLEQQDPELWVDRANARASAQRYWEAVADLNQALTIMPEMVEALRLRGQIWYKLGMTTKAEADFRHAAQVQAEEDVLKTKKVTKVSQKP